MKATNGYPGLYIVLEGIIGSGKSTQIELLSEVLNKYYPEQEIVYTREPGGTPKAEEIREIVKFRQLEPLEEAHLFAEARVSERDRVTEPALRMGRVVVKDRDIISSTAYQGEGRGLGWREVLRINKERMEVIFADVYVFCDVGIDCAVRRSGQVDPDKFDREGKKFWERVRRGYLEVFSRIRTQYPQMKIIGVSDPEGTLSPGKTHELIMERLNPIIEGWVGVEGRIRGERHNGSSSKER